MHRRQQTLRHRSLGQRQQPRLVQRRRRALRLRIELPDRLNLISEELEPHRPVRFWRIHVENPTAPRVLPRHLHNVVAGVANARQVRQQRLDVHFLAAPQNLRQPRVERRREQLHRRRFHWRNHNRRFARRDLPQRLGPLLLNVRMRRQILKRQYIVRRQMQHPLRRNRARQLAARPRRQQRRFRSLVIGHHQHHWSIRGPRKQRNVESPRR